jgi:hypothetical protein
MGFFMVTNNPQVPGKYPGLTVNPVEGSVLSLFTGVRDYIHRGHRLLTHPLSGSLKPGRIPYKTVILTAERAGLDSDSLNYIEASIEAYHKTLPETPASWEAGCLDDYAAVDLAQVEAALESLTG